MIPRLKKNPYDASTSTGKLLLHSVALLLMGMLLGHLLTTLSMKYGECAEQQQDPATQQKPKIPLNIPQAMQIARDETASKVRNVKDLPYKPTSHKSILKQELLPAFSTHPHLAGVSIGLLHPDQTIERHSHKSMSEFFFVLSGHGYARLQSGETNQRDHEALIPVSEGSFVFVGPNHSHSFLGSVAGSLPGYPNLQNASQRNGARQQQPMKLLYFGVTDD